MQKIDFFSRMVMKLYAPTLKQKTNFFRLLAVSQKAGLGIRQALLSIRASEKHRGLQLILDDIIGQINAGVNLGDALARHDYAFGIDQIELIRSAETMGNLPDVLEDIAIEMENFQKIQGKIKKALTYPTVLILFTIIAVVILLIFVIPTIVGMFPSQDSLPMITQFMLAASDFMKATRFIRGFVLVGLVVLYKFLYAYALPFKVFIDKLLISTPVVAGVTKTFYMYRFSKLLGQFYAAGVNPVVALHHMTEIFQNFHYKKKMVELDKDLNAGFSFSESLEGSSYFDPILVQILHVGEDTGNIGGILERMASFYREELDNKVAILMSMVEPLLMAVVAIVIGVVVGSIFLPMADLVNQI